MTSSLVEGKRADSARRPDRVMKALDAALWTGSDITVSGLARAARVDRSFLYCHRDLLEHVHAAAADMPFEEADWLSSGVPPCGPTSPTRWSGASVSPRE